MEIIDIIHGYQPFNTKCFEPWVIKNLTSVFIPTSITLKENRINQNIQLQGWTIDEWLSKKKTSSLANIFLGNLKESKTITTGCSTYSHALLPSLSYPLAYALIYLDYTTVRKNIKTPTFFFPPELAIDKNKLELLLEYFPGLIPILPNKSIGSKNSEVILVEYKKKGYLCLSANIFLKDTLMNGTVYQNISYLPKSLSKKKAKFSLRTEAAFNDTLKKLDDAKIKIIPRDWENGESKNALIPHPKNKNAKILSALINQEKGFKLIDNELKPTRIVKLNSIKPSCWEPKSTPKNPFPYWLPQNNNITLEWKKIISIYEKAFSKIFEIENLDPKKAIKIISLKLQEKKYINILKSTSPALASCIPWHYLSREEWDSDISYAKKMIKFIVVPSLKEITKKANIEFDKNSIKYFF